MIERNIRKLWQDSTAETGLTTYYVGNAVEADVIKEGYPCMALYSNTWDDQDWIGAVNPGKSYAIDGSVALRFYSDKQLDVIKGYPIWRNTFITETSRKQLEVDGITFSLDTMTLTGSSISVERVIDKKVWYLELVSDYLLTLEYNDG